MCSFQFAPPESVIEVRHNPEKQHKKGKGKDQLPFWTNGTFLAQTLADLSNNESAYLEYFKWRDKFNVQVPYQWGCDVCYKLNNLVNVDSKNQTLSKVPYDNLFEWWVSKSQCENSPIKWSDIGNIARDFYHLLF